MDFPDIDPCCTASCNVENSQPVENDANLQRKLSDITKEMGSIGSTLKDFHINMQQRMDSFENDMCHMRSQISEIRHPDPEINFNENRHQTNHTNVQGWPRITTSMPTLQNQTNVHTNHDMGGSSNTLQSFNIKMKPQAYDGTTDISEYLTQFNLIAEINQWPYSVKSLYLASCLSGNARSLLSELTETQKRDYNHLVEVLKTRFGTQNRAEIYRSQLKSMSRQKTQSIPELAQHVKKLTRQAYPDANSDLTEILALDCFIDSLDDSDLRLRLRECCPKTMTEAETIAVRLETHKLADKQRIQHVNAFTNQDKHNSSCSLESILHKIETLTQKVDKLDALNSSNKQQTTNTAKPNSYNHWARNQNMGRRSYHRPINGSSYNSHNNHHQNYTNNRQNLMSNNQRANHVSGNEIRSSWGAATRPSHQ